MTRATRSALLSLAALGLVAGGARRAEAGQIFGTSSSNNGSILAYDTATHVTTVIASNLSSPTGLAFAPDGTLYVAERTGNTNSYFIEKFSQSGTDLGTFATGLSTSFRGIGLAFDSAGDLFATESGVVHEFFAGGGGRDLAAPPGFFLPYQLAVDGSGALYVTDSASSNVYKYDTTQASPTASTFATLSGRGNGVATDAMGNVYISTGSGTFKFTAAGTAIPNPTTTTTPFSTQSGFGLTFGASDGLLYVVNPPSLLSINPTTGAHSSTSASFPSTEYIAAPPAPLVAAVPEPSTLGSALAAVLMAVGLGYLRRPRGPASRPAAA
jgi:sugar lactone lactonase YvrE